MKRLYKMATLIMLSAGILSVGCILGFFEILPAIYCGIIFGSGWIFLLLSVLKTVNLWKQLQAVLRIAKKNNCLHIPDKCLMSEEINALLNNYKDSLSTISQKAEDKSTQLQILIAQINPHFLYNTLESIRGQAIFTGDDIVADMTETLSAFFRYCISRKSMTVSLNEELQNVQMYVKIMLFRYPDKFSFSIIGNAENLLDTEIPKLVLQPVVENAIQHGIMDLQGEGRITIRVLETSSGLKIYVRDNGVGIAPEKVVRINTRLMSNITPVPERDSGHSGIALYNICRRIRLLYGEEYGIRVYSTLNAGTNVMIHLPLKQTGAKKYE